MAKFAIFFKFKAETIKAMMANPSDRGAVVNKLCESAGGRMLAYYLMFGQWDGFVVFEVPDSAGAGAVSLAVTSTGAFGAIETHELIDTARFAAMLGSAGGLTYTPPGS
ncbi:MAG TPA: GYD domain-containing protein [Jatrophihabitantaceae bacterium]|jgi:uncharacterized protein with GYD domain|nr:GYD domain-containing protein [Jatrophihabitantaceae bacterium]